jgi:hypothetical protein
MTSHNAADKEFLLKVVRDAKFRDWQKQWDNNATLKAKRSNPNILFKGPALGGDGDVLEIKAIEVGKVSKATGSSYKFKVPSPKLFVRLRVLNEDFTALKDSAYSLALDGIDKPFEGKTDGNGQLEVEVPPDTQEGTLTVSIPPATPKKDGAVQGNTGMSWAIKIGSLNPIREEAPDTKCISGVQQRLLNLAFPTGDVTGVHDDQTKDAIRAFQAAYGIKETGDPDPGTTQAKLQEVHDKPDSIVKPPGMD